MILPLAAFMNYAIACAPQMQGAVEPLKGIAITESRLDPLAIKDDTTGRSYWPRDKAEAVSIAGRLISAGHNIDAGLMGINLTNWRWLGLTPDTVFDPCQNIRAGATVLTAFSRYNTGSPTRGFHNGYVARVIQAAAHAIPQPAAGSQHSLADGSLPPQPVGGPPNANPFARPSRWPSEMSFNAPRDGME
ncbi:MAG: lytic transglycosylase domain-containing protein [Stellaceae bacterium]